MNSTTARKLFSALPPLPAQQSRFPDAPPAVRRVLALLECLPQGTLELQLPGEQALRFPSARAQPDMSESPRATLRVHNWRVFERALRSGDIGFAESFIDGDWSSPDIVAVLELFIANRQHIEGLVYGSFAGRLLGRMRHLLNRNSRRGSRRNIQAHYDLGNAFYRLWLDPSMSYSGALFEDGKTHALEQAQHAKVLRALREAGVGPGSRVLEIGCGWGGLAQIAAGELGARVTGITLSHEQLAYARARVAAAGLQSQCEFRLQDYRDLGATHREPPFDAVVSIEMFEAVGREYWETYLSKLRDCLRPGGRACVQSITIREDLFARYMRSTDFIQQYIFPGGLLPSVAAFEAQARKAGLRVLGRLAFGADYAQTLRHWRAAYLDAEPQVRALGFDTRFVRTWDFYLAYCQAAFALGNTDVIQFTLQRPQ